MTSGSSAPNPRNKQPEVRANTLRLDKRTLAALMDRFDSVRKVRGGTSRRYTRFPYRLPEVNVVLTHPGGSVSTLVLCARDISAGGVSLLHNSYVHKGSTCNVLLDRPGQSRASIPGKVVRCNQLAGLVHEVGIAFNVRVSLRDFLCPGPLDEFFSLEHVNPSDLKGNLLHLDDTSMGRRLLKAFMSESSLSIQQVENVSKALEAAKHPFDAILTEYQAPDGNAADLIMALRVKQVAVPVIVLLGENSADATDRLRAVAPAGVLKKPISQERLHRCLAEVMLLTRPKEETPVAADDSRADMVRVYLEELRSQARDLEIALKDNRTDDCLTACRELRASAPTLGFADIAKLAESAERALTSRNAGVQATVAVKELVSCCRRTAA